MSKITDFIKNLFSSGSTKEKNELGNNDYDGYYDSTIDRAIRRVFADLDRAEAMIKADLEQYGSVQRATERFIRSTGHLDYENGSLVSYSIGEPEDHKRILDDKALSKFYLGYYTPVGSPLAIKQTEEVFDERLDWHKGLKYTLEDGTVILTRERDRDGIFSAHDEWDEHGYRLIRSFVPLLDDSRTLRGFQEFTFDFRRDSPSHEESQSHSASLEEARREKITSEYFKMVDEVLIAHEAQEQNAALDDEMEPD